MSSLKSSIFNLQSSILSALLAAGMMAGTAANMASAATILSQNFSTDPVNYTLPGSSNPFRYDTGPRYWAKSDMAGLTVNAGITGSDGPYLGTQNIDGGGVSFSTTAPAQIDFTVSMAGYSDLKLSIALAGMPNAETANFIRAKTDNDGDGTYETTIFNFLGGANNNPYTDATLGALTSAFKTFSNIALPTPTAVDGKLRLRLESFNDTDSQNEATGIDSILISGTPPAVVDKPVIANLVATNVALESAWLNGMLTSTGTSDTAVFVLWGTSDGGTNWGNWANTNAWAAPQTTNAPFTTNVTGLASNTTYYYRFAATNLSGAAWAASTTYFITGEVTVQSTDAHAQFPDNTGAYTIYRPLGCTNEQLIVHYAMSGTATNGVHYNTLSGNALFNVGATSTVVTLTPKRVGISDADLTLAGGYGYPVGTPSNATVTILPPVPQIENHSVTNVTMSGATFNGHLISNSTEATTVCVLWGETNGGQTWAWAHTNWFAGTWPDGAYLSTNITGLSGSTTYYYTFGAKTATSNAVAADPVSFTTGEVTVQATDPSAQCPFDTGAFTIFRPLECTNAPLTVYYTMSGSATNGMHYNLLSGNATILAGETSTVVTLTPKFVGVGNAILTLLDSYNYPVGASPNNSATVTIAAATPPIPSEMFVATNSPSPSEPYATWGTAAHDIKTAVDLAAALYPSTLTVTVSNGIYNITSEITVTNGITVRSYERGLSGATNTTINAGNVDGRRVVYVNHAGAVLDGFTITGGKKDNGAGVYLAAGTVQNCRITANNGLASGCSGVGMWVGAGGLVSNCLIFANAATVGAGGQGGAGIYINGGIVRYSTISDNRLNGSGDAIGGGIYSGSSQTLVESCIIASNSVFTTWWGHGGGYYGKGKLRNCLIVGNSVALGAYYPSYGGGLRGDQWSPPAVLENCTVVGNDAPSGGAVSFCTVTNSIVWNNRSVTIGRDNYWDSTTFNYSFTTPLPVTGVGNVQTVEFVDFGGGDYRLRAGPAVDSGTNQTWMVGATDLAGNPRILNAVVDMGAYEYVTGPLECFVSADVTDIAPPAKVVFTAYVYGTNVNVQSYAWDFGDGKTTNGATLRVVTNLYETIGSHTVKLTVSNDVGETFTVTNLHYIAVWDTKAYVWTNSPSPAKPYNTWTNASRTIGDAVVAAPAGTVVIVTNGTYNITAPITLSRAITVRSVEGGLSGASNTVVQASSTGYRIFDMTHTNAVIEGLTIRNGQGPNAYFYGCGVNMSAGLVRDCIIRDNGYMDRQRGAGVNMTGGTVSNCIVRNNACQYDGQGGGIRASGDSQILSCQILENRGGHDEWGQAGQGGGIYVDSSSTVLVRNCLIARNYMGNQTGNGHGAGIYMNSGTVESCTIVSNILRRTDGGGLGGGIYRTGGSVKNCIILLNRDVVTDSTDNYYATGGIDYSCTEPPPGLGLGAGNIAGDPLFVNLAGGDYTLQKTSPCIDAGTNQTWMTGAKDLAGNDRILKGTSGLIVDMGAYETFVPTKGTMIQLR